VGGAEGWFPPMGGAAAPELAACSHDTGCPMMSMAEGLPTSSS
jgi:hypothetical protein